MELCGCLSWMLPRLQTPSSCFPSVTAVPGQISSGEGRNYIRQQMASNPSLPTPPSIGQLDGIMNSMLTAFPGLQDCVNKIMQTTCNQNGTGEPDMNSIVDQVQQVLLGPMMQNIKATNPNAQILAPP